MAESSPPKSIVLVDDERSYAELLAQLLTDMLDCPVHTFTRPAEALAVLSTFHPGVVITDYYMPEMNGLEFIRRAAPLVPEASFLLITGHHLPALEAEMKKVAPLKGFLAKPFGGRKLAGEILRVWPAAHAAPAFRADATSS